MGDTRMIRHAAWTRAAEVGGAMVARAGMADRASVTVRDGGVTWLLSWPDVTSALAVLRHAVEALEDLQVDLDPPVVVDLDMLRATLERTGQ